MTDIHNQNIEELKRTVEEKRNALGVFRFGMAGSKIKNVKEGRTLRKEIARLKTEISGRTTQK